VEAPLFRRENLKSNPHWTVADEEGRAPTQTPLGKKGAKLTAPAHFGCYFSSFTELKTRGAGAPVEPYLPFPFAIYIGLCL